MNKVPAKEQQCALIAMTLSSSCAGPRSAATGKNMFGSGVFREQLGLLALCVEGVAARYWHA